MRVWPPQPHSAHLHGRSLVHERLPRCRSFLLDSVRISVLELPPRFRLFTHAPASPGPSCTHISLRESPSRFFHQLGLLASAHFTWIFHFAGSDSAAMRPAFILELISVLLFSVVLMAALDHCSVSTRKALPLIRLLYSSSIEIVLAVLRNRLFTLPCNSLFQGRHTWLRETLITSSLIA